MIAEAGASPATVAASMMRVDATPWRSTSPGQHRLELIGRRVVGVIAEFGDAVGQAGVGEHGGDRLHAPVDAARLHARLRIAASVERLDERVEAFAVVVVERLDGGDELVVGGGLERAIEQTERLHPVLHLIHGPRRYRLRRQPAADRPCWSGHDRGPGS